MCDPMAWGWIIGGVIAIAVGSVWWIYRDPIHRTIIPGSMRPDASRTQRLRRFWFSAGAVFLILWGLYTITYVVVAI
jgi:hypothetical protein